MRLSFLKRKKDDVSRDQAPGIAPRGRSKLVGFLVGASAVTAMLAAGVLMFPDQVSRFIGGTTRPPVQLAAIPRAPRHIKVGHRPVHRGLARVHQAARHALQKEASSGKAATASAPAGKQLSTSGVASDAVAEAWRMFDPISHVYVSELARLDAVVKVLKAKTIVAQLVQSIVQYEQQAGVDVDCVIRTGGDISKCRAQEETAPAQPAPQQTSQVPNGVTEEAAPQPPQPPVAVEPQPPVPPVPQASVDNGTTNDAEQRQTVASAQPEEPPKPDVEYPDVTGYFKGPRGTYVVVAGDDGSERAVSVTAKLPCGDAQCTIRDANVDKVVLVARAGNYTESRTIALARY